MYIYTFLTHLQLYPIHTSRYPLEAFYYGIYTHADMLSLNIQYDSHHQYYLVYSLHDDLSKLYAIAIDEEMHIIEQYKDYHLILPRKASIYLDEAIMEGLRLYDEFVLTQHQSYLPISLQWPSTLFASMLSNGQINEQPCFAYFDYNPIVYQLAYERFVYFIKKYCYYRLKMDRQGYPVKNFEDSLKHVLNMYVQRDYHTYHLYSLTHLENKELDLFLSQIAKKEK